HRGEEEAMTSIEHELQLASAVESCHDAVALPKEAVPLEGSGYTSLTALSSDWYWEQDSDFRFTKMVRSPCAAPLPGFIQSVPIGHRRWEMTGARALSETWDQHRARLEARQPFRDFQHTVFVDSYSIVNQSSSGEPVFNARGRFAGYRGTSRDIATERLSDQRLGDEQAALQMAIKAGPVGTWSVGLASSDAQWSSGARAILEVPAGSPSSMEDALNACSLEYRGEFRSAVATCIRDGKTFSFEASIVTARQRRIWVRTTGRVEQDSTGATAGVRGALHDITLSKQAIDQNGRLSSRLSLTLQAMKDGFFALDRQWRFTYVNPEAERALCRQTGDLLGKMIWDEFPEAVGSNLHRQYERALVENVPVFFREFFAPLKLWAQVRAYPDPEGLLVFFSDVTESAQAQQEIAQLNAGLEDKVRVRTAQLQTLTKEMETFSYSVAHDLRSPLAAISGFGKILEKEFGPFVSERGRHLLSRIRAAAGQMEEMTEGLLALARVSPVEMRPRSVDLGQIAAALLERLREREPDRNVDIQIMRDLRVQGDAALLTQALSNLLSNAWKFTGKQPQARIEVGSQTGPDGLTVYFVKDNGAGFDMNYASRLFGVFSRLHSTSEFEGTGIGLAIVKKVIDRHAGRLWAESVPDQGASFYFTLKADDCRAASVAEASDPPRCEPS
ncbi:MAG: ATP-binding protein, partial [Ramlibacter sp.]